MKPSELYALTPRLTRQSTGDDHFPMGPLERHLEGVEFFDIPDGTLFEGIEYKWYADVNFPDCGGWELLSVWFTGRPFMIVRQAGRQNRDYNDHFVTDMTVYGELQEYLSSLVVTDESHLPVHDPDVDIENLSSFHGNDLSDFYDAPDTPDNPKDR